MPPCLSVAHPQVEGCLIKVDDVEVLLGDHFGQLHGKHAHHVETFLIHGLHILITGNTVLNAVLLVETLQCSHSDTNIELFLDFGHPPA